MKKQEWLEEYRRLAGDLMSKASKAESYAKNQDPDQLAGDSDFARLQDDVSAAGKSLEEFWKKFHSGQIKLD